MRPYSVLVYTSGPHSATIASQLPRPPIFVTRDTIESELARRSRAIVFADAPMLPQVDDLGVPVVAILDAPGARMLKASVESLVAFPWVSHCISSELLSSTGAKAHLETTLERLFFAPEVPMLGGTGVGRVALLAQASRRESRFERMRRFFEKHAVSPRAITAVSDVAEELVMNALYDAPFEAGFLTSAVSRMDDISLPDERACEISYGIDGTTLYVRVRDSFGSLSRERLVNVLERCSANAVALDESRGGAGLGLWRVFSAASTISVVVRPTSVTDILVQIVLKNGKPVKHLGAVHLQFEAVGPDRARAPRHHSDFDRSVTLVA